MPRGIANTRLHSNEETGALADGELHPASASAVAWISRLGLPKLQVCLSVFESSGLRGNRSGQVCVKTLGRLIAGEKVSDRDVLGLAWTLRDMGDGEVGFWE
jgi:hypothetical protein